MAFGDAAACRCRIAEIPALNWAPGADRDPLDRVRYSYSFRLV
jgi:hypothetical protein